MVACDSSPTLEWLRQEDYEYQVSLSHIAKTLPPPHTQRQQQECYKLEVRPIHMWFQVS